MKVQLKRLGILRTGTVLAAFYGVLMLLVVPFMLIAIMADPDHDTAPIPLMIWILMMYPVLGFIGGIIMAAVYNLVARATGGLILEMDVEPVQEQTESDNGRDRI